MSNALSKKAGSEGAAADIDERYIVPGLVRGLQVLQSFTDNRQPQSAAEIARRVNLSRPTAFRLVYTLEVTGFLKRVPSTNKFELGSRVLELGYSFLAGKDLIEIADPVLRALRDETQTSTHLVVREGRDAVYIARFPATTGLISSVRVGSRLPAHATAPGRVLLAGVPLAELVALYDGYEFESYTSDTPTSLGSLIRHIEQDRLQPGVVSWGFYEPDVASVAAPVFNAAGKLEAAVSVSCPINLHAREEFEGRIRREVEAAAVAVSRSLGYRPTV
jgi:DNA-binding IclR family transcriptional regulator